MCVITINDPKNKYNHNTEKLAEEYRNYLLANLPKARYSFVTGQRLEKDVKDDIASMVNKQ